MADQHGSTAARSESNEKAVAPEKKKYERPVLVKYGKLEEVTRAYNRNC